MCMQTVPPNDPSKTKFLTGAPSDTLVSADPLPPSRATLKKEPEFASVTTIYFSVKFAAITSPSINALEAVTAPSASTANDEVNNPPNLIVPSFKLISEPAVADKLFDLITPVVRLSPDIFVDPPP